MSVYVVYPRSLSLARARSLSLSIAPFLSISLTHTRTNTHSHLNEIGKGGAERGDEALTLEEFVFLEQVL